MGIYPFCCLLNRHTDLHIEDCNELQDAYLCEIRARYVYSVADMRCLWLHCYNTVFFSELPIFTTKAHVFHIDPDSKKKWLPLSTHAVNVSYYHDSARHLYRIISVDGTKVCASIILLSTMLTLCIVITCEKQTHTTVSCATGSVHLVTLRAS